MNICGKNRQLLVAAKRYGQVMCNPKKTEHETTKSHFENFILLPLDNIDTGWRFSLSAFYFNSQID